MNLLLIKGLIIFAVFAGWSTFMFKAGVNDCKADFNKNSEAQFNTALQNKQIKLDAAIKLQGEWQTKVTELQKRKPPKVTHEKENIKNNNTSCSNIDGFSVFIRKLQEGNTTEVTESN